MNLQLDGLTLPLTICPAQPLSDLELERFSRDNQLYRIERNRKGELVVTTPVGTIGSNHEGYVFAQLGHWNEEAGQGICFAPNGGFTLRDGSCLAPDGCWISLEHWNALTPENQQGYAHICPDFLVEVRSVSDSLKELQVKMERWIENGAQLAWLIDPIDAAVSIYRPGQATETLERPDLVLGHAPVEGFQLKTTRLWPPV